MTDLVTHPLVKKAATVVVSAIIGFTGNTIVQNKLTNVKQDQELQSLQKIYNQFPELSTRLSKANTNVAVLNQRVIDLLDRIKKVETDEHR